MATAIGLAMQITANTAGLAKGVSATEKLLGNLGRAAGNVDKLFGTSFAASAASVGESLTALGISVPGAVAGFTALAAAGGATISYLVRTADQVERLTFAADKLGASFDFVQVLDEAARRSGSSIDNLGVAFNKLLVKISEARGGNDKAAAAFERLGIQAKSLQALTPEDTFKMVAEALVTIEDPAERAAAAIAIFGKSGAELLPTLKAINESSKDIERFNAAITGADVGRVLEIDSAFERLGTSVTGVLRSITLPFAGILSSVASGIADVIGGITSIVVPIKQVLTPALDGLGAVAGFALSAVGGTLSALGLGLQTAVSLASTLAQWTGISSSAVDSIEDATVATRELSAATEEVVSQLSLQLTAAENLRKIEEANAAAAADANKRLLDQQLAAEENKRRIEQASADERQKAIEEQLDGLLEQERIQRRIAAFDEEAARQQREDFAAAFAARQQEVADENNRIAEERRTLEERLAGRTAEIRAARGAEFSRRSDQPLRVQDVRRGGIDDVLRFLGGRQDPAVSEAAKQTTELKAIKAAIDSLRAEPVTILGAA
jgi:hypothetical protein